MKTLQSVYHQGKKLLNVKREDLICFHGISCPNYCVERSGNVSFTYAIKSKRLFFSLFTAMLLRPTFVRRMGVEANENPAIAGNVVLLAGITLAVACGSFVSIPKSI